MQFYYYNQRNPEEGVDIENLAKSAQLLSKAVFEYSRQFTLATGIPAEQVLMGLVVIFLIMSLLGQMEAIFSTLIGVIYPGLMTLQALETPDTEDDRIWLTYWLCFSMFMVLDKIMDKFYFKKIIPFYFFIKIGILVFLMHPRFGGAQIIYHQILVPYLRGQNIDPKEISVIIGQRIEQWRNLDYSKLKDDIINFVETNLQE